MERRGDWGDRERGLGGRRKVNSGRLTTVFDPGVGFY